jgi:hypothetical protein
MALSQFALGTVQLGLPYGAANKTGMPSEEDAIEIAVHAAKNGVGQVTNDKSDWILGTGPPFCYIISQGPSRVCTHVGSDDGCCS